MGIAKTEANNRAHRDLYVFNVPSLRQQPSVCVIAWQIEKEADYT